MLQIVIRRRRIREGLDAVEHERARWHTATHKKELLEEMATRLRQPAYQYFQARKEQYDIMRELAEDRAPEHSHPGLLQPDHPYPGGQATEAEILMDAPWPFFEAFDVCVLDADVDNPLGPHQAAPGRRCQGPCRAQPQPVEAPGRGNRRCVGEGTSGRSSTC